MASIPRVTAGDTSSAELRAQGSAMLPCPATSSRWEGPDTGIRTALTSEMALPLRNRKEKPAGSPVCPSMSLASATEGSKKGRSHKAVPMRQVTEGLVVKSLHEWHHGQIWEWARMLSTSANLTLCGSRLPGLSAPQGRAPDSRGLSFPTSALL